MKQMRQSKPFWLAAVAAFLVSAAPVNAQNVTVCQGTSSCTVVYGGASRQMTPEELQTKNRNDSMDAITRVNCEVAANVTLCYELRGQLRRAFFNEAD